MWQGEKRMMNFGSSFLSGCFFDSSLGDHVGGREKVHLAGQIGRGRRGIVVVAL